MRIPSATIDESKVEAFRKSAVPITPEFEGFCPDKPCVHGKCVEDENGILSCHCKKGFTGQRCDVAIEKRSASEVVVRVPVDAARTAEIASAAVISVLLLVGTIFMLYFLVSSRRRQKALKDYWKHRSRLHPQAASNVSNNAAPPPKGGGLCSCCPCCKPADKAGGGKGAGSTSGSSAGGEKKKKKGKKGGKKGGGAKKKKRVSTGGRYLSSDKAPLLSENRNQQCLYHSSTRSPMTRDGRKNRNVSSSHTRRNDHHDCLCALGKDRDDYDWERAYRAVRSSRYSHLNISQNYHYEEANPAPQNVCLTQPSSLKLPATSARLGTMPDDFDEEFAKTSNKVSTLSEQGGSEQPTVCSCWQSDSEESPPGCRGECRPLLQGNSTRCEPGGPAGRPEQGDGGKSLSTSVARVVDSNRWEQPLPAQPTGGDEIFQSEKNRTPKIDEKKALVKSKLADHAPLKDTLLPNPGTDEEKRLLATMQWCADQNDRLLRFIDASRKQWLVTAHSLHDSGVLTPINPQKEDPRCEQEQPKNHDNVLSHGVPSKTGAGTRKRMTTHPPSRRTSQGKEVHWQDPSSPEVSRHRITKLGRSRVKLGLISKATPLDDKSQHESKPLDVTMMPVGGSLPRHLFPYTSSDHMHLGACSPFLTVVHSNRRSKKANCFFSTHRKNAVETVPGSQGESLSFYPGFSAMTSDCVRGDDRENASSAGDVPKAPLRCISSRHDAPPGISEPKSKLWQELSTSIVPQPRVDGEVTLQQAERPLDTDDICVDPKRYYTVKDSTTEPIPQTIKTQHRLDLSTIPLVWSLEENKDARLTLTEPEVNWGPDQALANSSGPFLSAKTSDRIEQDVKKELKPPNVARNLAQSEVPEDHSANAKVSQLLKTPLNCQTNEEVRALQAR
ncbi:uncharacterized protein LOC112557774 isoform X2 [Pomacea canaliculata]|uniref:uncharacterized protein LOC112557774 isoform X2 n=1 Tax=Pomacea canaliculata TaxID=400727 RepID=UPI000D72A2C3|nr:uncharacterized protein LOC112557774 isoform X2 [Pomacea canaliculata]